MTYLAAISLGLAAFWCFAAFVRIAWRATPRDFKLLAGLTVMTAFFATAGFWMMIR